MVGLAGLRGALPLMCATMMLAACSSSDVGEVAARKSALTSDQAPAAMGAREQTIKTLRELRPEVGGTCNMNPATNLLGLGHLTPAKVSTSRIEKGNMMSMRLRSLFISDFGYTPENIFSDFGLSSKALGETTRYFVDGFDHNFEILVAVNAFDYNKDDNGFRFSPEHEQNAKVIYYSEDVEEGQFLNFDNLPIIGPIEYSGSGFGLQLYVMEIDAGSDQQKALLKSMAGVGVAAAGITGPGAGVLNSLTKALVENGNTDDRMFDYAIGFDTGYPGANVEYVPLEENLYAFVTDHDRRRTVPWHKLAINNSTAELMECKDGKWQVYKGSTYAVVQVLKGFQGQPPGQFAQQTVGKLTQELRDKESGSTVDNAIDEFAGFIKQKSRLNGARDLVGQIHEGVIRTPDPNNPTGPGVAQNPARAQYAALKLSQLLTETGSNALSDSDKALILSDLYKIAVEVNGGQTLDAADFPTFDPTKLAGTTADAYLAKLKKALKLT